ncbi:uncharacterized protein LOC141904342 [Tubulanus polymorphus]|uniref:uncharacterized protein LOC141904342 n=1 Tax=Tubulanus polymorphus TaxID=672921 RepID=UPI003DA5BB5B
MNEKLLLIRLIFLFSLILSAHSANTVICHHRQCVNSATNCLHLNAKVCEGVFCKKVVSKNSTTRVQTMNYGCAVDCTEDTTSTFQKIYCCQAQLCNYAERRQFAMISALLSAMAAYAYMTGN